MKNFFLVLRTSSLSRGSRGVVYLVVVFAALCVASDDTEMSQDLAIRTMFKQMRQVSSLFATFSMIISMSQELCSSACSHQAASAAATQVLMDSGPMAQVRPPPMAMESRPSLLIVFLGECTKRKTLLGVPGEAARPPSHGHNSLISCHFLYFFRDRGVNSHGMR